MLPTFLRRSVRAKITALVVTTTLAALALSAVALIYYTVRDYRETQLPDVRTQAEILGRASAPALAFNDRKDAMQDIAMLKARPDVEQAAVVAVEYRLHAELGRQLAVRNSDAFHLSGLSRRSSRSAKRLRSA